MKKVVIFFALLLSSTSSLMAQQVQISGKVTGKIARMVKEVLFIRDGKSQQIRVDSTSLQFGGNLKLQMPQFVEVKSGNNQAQYYYMVPNERLQITIDKPSMQQSIVTITGQDKGRKLQEIFDSYYKALQEKGIDIKIKDWHMLLFTDNTPLKHAETRLDEQMKANAGLVNAYPDFKADMRLFKQIFRKYTEIDTMSLREIESNLQALKEANLKNTALNIPFLKEYLTDLTNAYAAKTLDKYGIIIDAIKQKNIGQFIAAEVANKYITDNSIKSYLFGEKLKIELAVNGLKNQDYVEFLLSNSNQFVKDFYKERLDQLKANKLPDLNSARKRAFDFTLQDAAGKTYKLDDFKGKMVFVDFWASWCAPCRAQIPYQRELEKAYEGKDVVFLSVSLDRSKEDWLKAVKEEDLHGYVLHAEGDFQNPFPKAYQIQSIPRYLLIDASGNIISDNMIRPQSKKEITAVFDEELYAKNTQSILAKHYEAIGADKLKTNELFIDYVQSVPAMKMNHQLWYDFPKRLKNNIQFDVNVQTRMIVGDDYLKDRFIVMDGDRVMTNFPSQSDFRSVWVNKIFGAELFLRTEIFGSVVKFAEENNDSKDSAYVLKLAYKDFTEKYYINKKTFLLDKIVILNNNLEPRKGGGYFESFISYSDYKNIDGVMLPFKINASNIISFKVNKAALKPMDSSLFETKGLKNN